jgi:predicted nuclease of predicted toxin-antitoxin system
MKLLFDQNLSSKLCQEIADLSPESNHVAFGAISWRSGSFGFTIVSQDVDFAEMAVVLGSPPKVIWLRAGNQSTAAILTLMAPSCRPDHGVRERQRHCVS